jgi:hypothetical protein
VSKLYKRKSKKTRNSAIQAPNTKRKKMKEAHDRVSKRDEGYASDSSSVFEEELEEEIEAPEEPEEQKQEAQDIRV